MRGATADCVGGGGYGWDFNPRAPCGARLAGIAKSTTEQAFQPTRPLRGATEILFGQQFGQLFQPTRPLRGATVSEATVYHVRLNFNPRAPCGARQFGVFDPLRVNRISTHAPLAGRDTCGKCKVKEKEISTHAPLAGRDSGSG